MIKNTVWLTLALAFRSLGQAGLLVVFARFGSPETLGDYSLALAITAPIFVLCEFGLRTVYLTHQARQTFKSYLQVRVATLFIAILLTATIGMLFVPAITTTLLLVSLLRAADSMGELYSAPLQRHDSIKTILNGFGLNALFTILVGSIVLINTNNLQLVIASLILVSAATTVLLMKRPTDKLLLTKEAALHLEARDRKADRRSVVSAGLPTGISWGLLSLLSSIPQYFLAIYMTQVEVGYFAVILYVVVVVEIFLNAVSQSWIPTAKKLQSNGQSFFKAVAVTSAKWTLAFVPVSGAACLAAYVMLPIVFGSSYSLGWAEITPLFSCLMALPTVFFFSMALNVANSYGRALVASVAALIVAVLAAWVLIPIYGVSGALWVSFVALASRAAFSLGVLALPHKPLKLPASKLVS